MRRFTLVIAVVWAFAAQVQADYETGMAAARRGDYAVAVRQWRPLAEGGDARAQNDLGFMYANGHGVRKDDAEAVRWYRKSAEQGFALAQFNLGYMYAHGSGVPKDVAEGLTWYRRAAAQGYPAAQFNLGVRYYLGEGVKRDFREAYFWFALAAEAGHERARRPRDDLAEALSPAERADIDERVRSWRAGEAEARAAAAPEPPVQRPQPAVAAQPEPPAQKPQPAVAAQPEPPAQKPQPAVAAQPEPPAQKPQPARLEPAPSKEHDGASVVQLGALRSHSEALREWDRLQGRHSDLIGDLEPRIQEVYRGGGRGVFYRLRAGPLADAAAAEELCAQLSARRVRCLLVDPASGDPTTAD